MYKGTKYYIFLCETDGSETPLRMEDDNRILEFETENHANIFLKRAKKDAYLSKIIHSAFVKPAVIFCDDGFINATEAELKIFGEKVPAASQMKKNIEELLDKYYFNTDDESYMVYGKGYYKNIPINKAIDCLFHIEGKEEEEYQCELVKVSADVGETIFVLYVVWIEDENLFTCNRIVYSL